MAAAGYELLKAWRLTRIIQQLQDVRDMPRPLVWLGRTPLTPAVDGEILGRWIGRVLMADVIPDDAKANVYATGKLNFEFTEVPNIKIGRHLSQSQINQLQSLTVGMVPGQSNFMDFAGPMSKGLLLGIRQRMEQMIVGMMIDNWTYDRFGFKVANLTWGMPSDLKLTVTTPWDNTAATPVTDIQTAVLVAQQRYGVALNRLTMSLQAFRYMIATTEFQNKAKVVIPQTLTYNNFSLLNIDQQRKFATSALAVDEIEFYDSRAWTMDAAGNYTSSRFLPINQVILDDSSNDNNPSVRDFANGVVTESIVMGMGLKPAAIIGSLDGGMRGPISFATVPPDLNAPNITMWGVARGFPRKYLLQSNATIQVGNFTDSIPVSEPF